MKKMVAMFITYMLLATACANHSGTDGKAPSLGPSLSVTPVATAPSPSPSTAPPASPTAAPSSATPVPNTTASMTKLYQVNKNYFVVPLDPNGNKKVVLLTFDDGPKKMEWIKSLIETLDKHHAKAIFFEIGASIKDHPELLQYTFERGETIGNHTWDHSDLKKLKDADIDSEIGKTQDIIKQTIGITPSFFRPPYGNSTDHVHQVVNQDDMVFMNWSNGSLDWDTKNTGKPDAIIANVIDQLHPGSIILMHELPTTVTALDKLLTQLEDKGYGFVDPSTIQTPQDMRH